MATTTVVRWALAACVVVVGAWVAGCEMFGQKTGAVPAGGVGANASSNGASSATPAGGVAQAVASAPAAKPPVAAVPLPAPGRKPVIYMIGDSTMKNGADDGATGGQWGYGHIMHYYFDETRITVENDALGGTSSRSFMKGNWPRVLGKLQAGDYVIMAFGHNDNTATPQTDTTRWRSTIRGNGDEVVDGLVQGGGTEPVHSFGWYMRQFCIQTKEKGATPIVASMIPRNSWTNGKKSRNTNDYAGWAKQAAAQVNAFYVPLNDLIADVYDKLGQAKVTADMFPAGEGTHTNWAGAKLNAQCMAEGLKALKDCPLKDYLLANPKVPDTADAQPGGRRGGARGVAPPAPPN